LRIELWLLDDPSSLFETPCSLFDNPSSLFDYPSSLFVTLYSLFVSPGSFIVNPGSLFKLSSFSVTLACASAGSPIDFVLVAGAKAKTMTTVQTEALSPTLHCFSDGAAKAWLIYFIVRVIARAFKIVIM
jgi:hypothetical protein